MRLLMQEKSLQRLRGSIAERATGVEVATLTPDGRIMLAGAEVDIADFRVDAVWLNLDAARAGFSDRILAIAQSAGARWVQTFNAGLDNPRYADLLQAGVRLCNSNAQARAISQYILAEVLCEWSRVQELRIQQAQGVWKPLPFREIDGSTWLILGYGHIGQETARRARSFGARVIGLRRTPAPDDNADLVAPIDDLFKHLPEADVVIIAATLTEQTRSLANADFFKAMKPRAVIANIARGAIVNEPDLLRALDAGSLGLAILDVFGKEPLPADDSLWKHPRVGLSPHNSNNGDQTAVRGDRLFLDNLGRLLAGEPLLNEVTSI